MSGYALPIQRLIKELSRFPGIGEKTATRLATFLIRASVDDAKRLAESILDVKERIRFCRVCFNLTESDICDICRDPSRDRGTLCIVEEPDALVAIEECGTFRGVYHVLHGALAPLDGIGPEHLRLQEMMDRINRDGVTEIILAMNPTVQGDATALLITKMVAGLHVRVTRIAQGIPVGGDLRYTDKMTLSKSLEFRRGM